MVELQHELKVRHSVVLMILEDCSNHWIFYHSIGENEEFLDFPIDFSDFVN